jgi:hypothetical protein
MLKHPFAYTSPLMSQYKITLHQPRDLLQTHFKITNFLKKPINVAKLDVLIHSAISDIQIIDKQDKENLKNILQSARLSIFRINIPILNAFTQINPKTQNSKTSEEN